MERFRQSHRYAETNGFVSAYPDFEQSMEGTVGLQYGTIMLSTGNVERRVVLASDLGYAGEDVGERSRTAHRFAERNGFVGGFPDWEQSLDGHGNLVYRIILLRPPIAERRIIRASQLGYAGTDVGERYRTAHCYAEANGFVGGFPDWEQGLDGSGELVYGVILVRAPGAMRRVVPAIALRMFTAFRFDAAIAAGDRTRLLERHCFAISRIAACGNLQPGEKQRLVDAYQKDIIHGVSNNPNANAEAVLGGDRIDVNFGNLFPLGNNEIAQTLIHEMMHCANYSHPTRQPTDVPFDGGAYYNSEPLRAEICIAGNQSLTAGQSPPENCRVVDGKFVYLRS